MEKHIALDYMERIKNPYCLDPKETSCPRLKKLGMEWNPTTGRLVQSAEKPTKTNDEITQDYLYEEVSASDVDTTIPHIPTKLPKSIIDKLLNSPNPEEIDEPDIDVEKQISTNHLPQTTIKAVRDFKRATSPIYLDELPLDVSDIGTAIFDPEIFINNNPEWTGVYKNQKAGFNIIKNDTTKEIHFNFRGFTSKNPNETKNVFNIFKGRDKTVQSSKDFVLTEVLVEEVMEMYPDYEPQFNGHSYGGYRAKYLASLYDKASVTLNSHHMPWSKFPKGGRHRSYTVVTDFLDLKHLFGITPKNESHFYVPQNRKVLGGFMDGHYIHQFFANATKSKWVSRFNEHIGVLGAVMIGLGTAEAITDAIHDKDPTNDIAVTSSGFTPGGLILDPDYQYSDEKPPQFGIDWGIYNALQPLKNSLLDNTSWGRQRRREEQEIKEAQTRASFEQGYAEQQNRQARHEEAQQPTQPMYDTWNGKKYVSYDGVHYTPVPVGG